jgi:hypothetical protein
MARFGERLGFGVVLMNTFAHQHILLAAIVASAAIQARDLSRNQSASLMHPRKLGDRRHGFSQLEVKLTLLLRVGDHRSLLSIRCR